MSMLDRRVQVLFDADEYALVEEMARQEHRSVGSVIRESVRESLSKPMSSKRVALDRLLARADSTSQHPVGDWQSVKDDFERASLENIA